MPESVEIVMARLDIKLVENSRPEVECSRRDEVEVKVRLMVEVNPLDSVSVDVSPGEGKISTGDCQDLTSPECQAIALGNVVVITSDHLQPLLQHLRHVIHIHLNIFVRVSYKSGGRTHFTSQLSCTSRFLVEKLLNLDKRGQVGEVGGEEIKQFPLSQVQLSTAPASLIVFLLINNMTRGLVIEGGRSEAYCRCWPVFLFVIIGGTGWFLYHELFCALKGLNQKQDPARHSEDPPEEFLPAEHYEACWVLVTVRSTPREHPLGKQRVQFVC